MGLKGCFAKIRRSKEHFELIEEKIHFFLESNPYLIVVERPEHGLYVFRVDNPPILPSEDWALLIGDCVHRSALDYIAWELSGADVADTQTLFPIFDTEAGWNKRGRSRIARLPQEAKALVNLLQPYRAPDPERAPLQVIRKLDDADKHKLLATVASVPIGFHRIFDSTSMKATKFKRMVLFPGPLAHDAILATVVLGDPQPDVDVKAELTPVITFGESCGLKGFAVGSPVVEGLKTMIAEVEAIASDFDVRFFR